MHGCVCSRAHTHTHSSTLSRSVRLFNGLLSWIWSSIRFAWERQTKVLLRFANEPQLSKICSTFPFFFSACCHSHSAAHGHSFFRRWFSPFSQSLDVESISFQFLTMRTFTEQSIWCVKVCWWCYDHSEGFWANFRVSACVLIYSTCADTDFVASERFIRNVTERMSCVHIIGALSSSLFTLERVFPLTCLHLQVSFPCELYFGQ